MENIYQEIKNTSTSSEHPVKKVTIVFDIDDLSIKDLIWKPGKLGWDGINLLSNSNETIFYAN